MNKALLPTECMLKDWAKLKLTKYRRTSGLCLAQGSKIVQELLASSVEIKALLYTPAAQKKWEAIRAGVAAPSYRLDTKQFARISQDTTPEGILAVARTPFRNSEALAASGTKLGNRLLLLYRVSNPGNLGAILRSALWFGWDTVLVGANSVDVGNHKVIKTSMGALFHLNIYEGVDLTKFIAACAGRYHLVALTLDGEEVLTPPLDTPNDNIALLLGGETHALPAPLAALSPQRWRIPASGARSFDSLSLPQAATVAMYALSRRK